MKINIILSAFGCIPPVGIGAVERLWYDLAREFVRQGHQVTLMAKANNPTQRDEVRDGLHILYSHGYARTRSRWSDLWMDAFYSWRSLRRMPKCDVCVLNTVTSPILCRGFRSKMTVSVYNVARFPRGQFRLYRHVDRLASCSSMITAAVLRQTPSVATTIKTINNPVNTSVFVSVPKTPHERFEIVYTGRIHEEKGLLNLVQAVQLLHQDFPVHLTLVGTWAAELGGSGEAYRALLERSAETGLVTFAGAVSDSRTLASYIQQADVYCYPPLPTTGDAMPCAPLEAMATGTPVVVSDLPCFDDYVLQEQTGLRFDVHHDAVRHLYQAFKRLHDDSTLAAFIARNGVTMAQRFSNEHIASVFLQDFQQLLQQKQNR
jgi:glycosyltransferase involved in cell wall biosynthesis